MRSRWIWRVVVVALVGSSLGAIPTTRAEAQACQDLLVTNAEGGDGLARALDEANACLGFQRITVQPGLYDVGGVLRITDEVEIVGDSPVDRPRITGVTSGPRFSTQATPGMTYLTNLDVVGSSRTGLLDAVGTTIVIDNVDFATPDAGPACGITTSPGIRANQVDLTVTNSTFTAVGCQAIVGFGGSTISLTDVTISKGGFHGVSVEGAPAGALALSRTVIADNAGDGINARGESTVTVDESHVFANGGNGIRQSSSPAVVTKSGIGVTPEGSPAGNAGIGLTASFADLTLTGVEIAHNDVGVRVSHSGTQAIVLADVSIHDNVSTGAFLAAGRVSASSTSITGNGIDCEYGTGAWRDGTDNIDSDGTCFPIPNEPPVAVDDVVGAAPGETITLDVLANDTDPEAGPLTIVSTTSPNATVAADGLSIGYTAPVPFTGEIFSYDIIDDQAEPATGSVRVELVCPDLAVTATDGGSGFAAAVESANDCPGAQTVTVEAGSYDLRSTLFVTDALSVMAADPANPPTFRNPGATSTQWGFYVRDSTGSFAGSHLRFEGSPNVGFAYFERVDATLADIDYVEPGTPVDCSIGIPNAITAEGGTLAVSDSTITASSCVAVDVLGGAVAAIHNVDLSKAVSHGIAVRAGTLDLSDSRIHANGRTGVFNFAGGSPVTITDSAIHGNGGNGVQSGGPTLAIRNSWIGLFPAGESLIADGNGGVGIDATFTNLLLEASTVANNRAGIWSAGQSQFSATITGTTIRDHTEAGLEVGNGASATLTETVLESNRPNCELGVGATVVDGGNNEDDDQSCGIFTIPDELVVNSAAGAGDANPGDGICSTGRIVAGETPSCTVRAALEESNAVAETQTVRIPAGVFTDGDRVIDVTDDVVIAGAGAAQTVLDAEFRLNADASAVDLERIEFVGAFSGPAAAGTLTIRDAIVSPTTSLHLDVPVDVLRIERSALASQTNTTMRLAAMERVEIIESDVEVVISGPASARMTDSRMRNGQFFDVDDIEVERSLIENVDNLSAFDVPGPNPGALRTVRVTNSTVIAYRPVSISAGATVVIEHSTISGGQYGIWNRGTDTTLIGTVVLADPGPACIGSFTATDIADSDGTCTTGALAGIDALLGPLQDNGGPTHTLAPRAGSPLIDGGTAPGCPATDQRGFPRPTDGTGNGTAACDIGAVELQEVTATGFQVNTTADESDASPGDGICSTGSSAAPGGPLECTLRAAVEEANASAGLDIVRMPAGTYLLAPGAPVVVTEDLRLIGGPGPTTIRGDLSASSPATLELQSVEIEPPPPPTAVSASLDPGDTCSAPVEIVSGVSTTTLAVPPGWVAGRPEIFACLRVTNLGDSPATELRSDGAPADFEVGVQLDPPLAPGESRLIDLGSMFGVPDGIELDVELLGEFGSIVDSTRTRVVVDAPPVAGAIDSWTTAGPDAFSACNDNYSYDANGVATGRALLVDDGPTDMWLCVTMRNNADGVLLLHELVVDPALPDGVAPPRPFDLTAEPGALVQRIVGPVPVVLEGAAPGAGFDVVWQADAPPFDPLLSDLSRIRFERAGTGPQLSIEVEPVLEGDAASPGEAVFWLTLRDPVTGTPITADLAVTVATEDRRALAGDDYVARSETLSFAVESRLAFRVPLIGDDVDEFDEDFVVVVTSADGVQLVDSLGRVTILDDDGVGAAPPFEIRLGRTATTACDGALGSLGDVPVGTLTLPAGGDPAMPLFICATYRNTTGETRLAHRLENANGDPSSLPFASQINSVVADGESLQRVLGPISGLAGAVEWEWTAYDEEFGAESLVAITDVDALEFTGQLTVTAGILAEQPTSCTGAEPTELVVPWGQGPDMDGFEVWYCVSATSQGNTALVTNEIRLLGTGAEVVVPVSGGLAAGETRRVLVGPIRDHPAASLGSDSRRTIEWAGLGPGFVPRVDDQLVVAEAVQVVVIESLEGAPLIVVPAVTVIEGGDDQLATATFEVRRGPALDETIAVEVSVFGGSGALPGASCSPPVDFRDPGTRGAGVGPGLPTATFDVVVCGDLVEEPDEEIIIEIREAGPGGELLAASTITIIDDDAPLVVGVAPDLEFTERDFTSVLTTVSIPLIEPAESPRGFRIALDGDLGFVPQCELGGDVSFGPKIFDGFAPDFQVDAGATALEFELSICFDRLPELTETSTFIVGDYDTAVEITRFDVTVVDDDTFPVIVGAGGFDWEDDGDGDAARAVFNVVTAAEVPWTYDVEVVGVGDAVGGVCGFGVDFGSLSPPVTLNFDGTGGPDSFGVPVGSCADSEIEDDFTVDVRLTPRDPLTPALGQPVTSRLLIRDDDVPPVLPGVTRIEVVEGTDTSTTLVDVVLPVLESAPAPHYWISVVPLFDSGDATFGACGPFVDLSGRAEQPRSIRPDDTTLELRFEVCADELPEPNRTAWFHVMSDDRQTIIATIVLTILDDDPFVTGIDTSVSESEDEVTVTFDVESPSIVPLWVRTVDGTAVSGPISLLADYEALGDLGSGPVRFGTVPGLTGPVDVVVQLIDDLDHETDETFVVEIWDAPVLGTRVASAEVTIVDDDRPPVLRIADVSVEEGPSTSVLELLGEGFDGVWPEPLGPIGAAGVIEIEVVEPPERLYDITLRASGFAGDTAIGSPLCDLSVLTGLTDYLDIVDRDRTTVTISVVLPGAVIGVERSALACGDLAIEGDETYQLHALDETGNELATTTVTIVDDDQAPTLVVEDVFVGESTGGDLVVNVTTPAYTPIWVRTVAGTADGTFGDTGDYTPRGEGLAGPLPITTIIGRTGPVLVPLEINDDPDHEPDETYTIEFWDAPLAGNRLAAATVTIVDDDAPPQVEGVDATFDESETEVAARFLITRAGETPTRLWAGIFSGSAIVDDDVVGFGPIPPSTLLPPGIDAPFEFPLTLIDDTIEEPSETFDVVLYDAPLLGTEVARATITITDTDRDRPRLAAPAPVEVVEGSSATLEFTVVEKSTRTNVDLVIGWTPTTPGVLVGGCPLFGPDGTDASVPTGLRQLHRNADVLPLNVNACPDNLAEPNRSFDVVVSTDDGEELARTTVTIIDDDRPPVVELRSLMINEGDPTGPLFNPSFNTVGTIELEVLEAPQRPYNLLVQTTGAGSAGLSPLNCIPVPVLGQSDALSFAKPAVIEPDSQGAIVEVETVLACANTVQHDGRWYGIEVVDGLGESGGVFDTATVTIVDDDGPTGGVVVGDATVTEGDSGARTVEVQVTVEGSTTPTNVDWSATELASPSNQRPASGGSDFEVDNGSLYFPPGGGTSTIQLTVYGDNLAEGDETFRVKISSSNGNVTDGEGLVRILDDDALRASVADATAVLEGDVGATAQLTFSISLDAAPASGSATVLWATSWASGAPAILEPDLAQPFYAAEPDFVHYQGSVVFHAGGPLAKTVTVDVVGDHRIENDERVYLFLVDSGNPLNPVIGDGVAIGVIVNDDLFDGVPPVITGATNRRILLTTAGTKMPVSYDVTAIDSRDGERPVTCTPISGSLFSVGATTVTCSATDLEDNTATETFTVTVETSGGGKVVIEGGDNSRGEDPGGGSEIPAARRGETVQVTSGGFAPNSSVIVELRSTPTVLGSFDADAVGVVDARVRIPRTAQDGPHNLVLVGLDPTGTALEVAFAIEVVGTARDVPAFTG